MESQVLTAYEYLIPADQILIDAMIIALYKKDKELRKLVKAIQEKGKQK